MGLKTERHGDEVPVIHTVGIWVRRAIIEPVVCPALRVGSHDAWAHGISMRKAAFVLAIRGDAVSHVVADLANPARSRPPSVTWPCAPSPPR